MKFQIYNGSQWIDNTPILYPKHILIETLQNMKNINEAAP